MKSKMLIGSCRSCTSWGRQRVEQSNWWTFVQMLHVPMDLMLQMSRSGCAPAPHSSTATFSFVSIWYKLSTHNWTSISLKPLNFFTSLCRNHYSPFYHISGIHDNLSPLPDTSSQTPAPVCRVLQTVTPHKVLSNHHTPNSDSMSLQAELDHSVADKDAGLGMDVAEVGLGSGCENAEIDNMSSNVEQYWSEEPEFQDSSTCHVHNRVVLTEVDRLSEETQVSDKWCSIHCAQCWLITHMHRSYSLWPNVNTWSGTLMWWWA